MHTVTADDPDDGERGPTRPAPVITATDVCVHYGNLVALAPSSFVLHAGTSSALVGPNGSGKSTLLGLLAGLIRPTSGTIRTGGHTTIAFVAQQLHSHRWMPIQVDEVLQMGRFGRRGLVRRFDESDRRAIEEAACRLDVDDLRRRAFGELSGGQRQRVLVAQALVAGPTLLLLDEPITGLDLASQQRIIDLIAEETAAGTTVVWSTHHLGEARHATRVMVLAGCLVADGRPDEVLRPAVLAEAYGDRMVAAGAGLAVIDDHGHGVEAYTDVGDLVPQHVHDHHAHDHHADDRDGRHEQRPRRDTATRPAHEADARG